jgi:hypothetical protein
VKASKRNESFRRAIVLSFGKRAAAWRANSLEPFKLRFVADPAPIQYLAQSRESRSG